MPTNYINGLASELFDYLYNENKETSFGLFQEFLTKKILQDDLKEHWFEMTFKNDEIKNYFLDKATEYIINNQTTQKEIIENLKSINFENDYRFSGIHYVDIKNIPEKFDNLFELYKWITIKKANNYLHYFGSNFTKSLLYEIIDKENATLHYSNYFNRIENILEKCQNDPILMSVILKSFHINIKLNIFLLSHPKYTQFGLLNIINNYEDINIPSEDHNYNTEWQKIIFNQTINIFFKHYNNLNFDNEIIFDVINYLADYGFKYNQNNKYIIALKYLLSKFENFYIQRHHRKEFYLEEIINTLIDKQIEQINSNDTFLIRDYYLMSWYLEKVYDKVAIEDKDYEELISKIVNNIEINFQKNFENYLNSRSYYLEKEYLKQINFPLFYKLSKNKNIWLQFINIEKTKSIINKDNKYHIIDTVKSFFNIYLKIFEDNKEDIKLQKYILNLAIEFGIEIEYGLFFSTQNNILLIDFFETLNYFEDSLFNIFIENYLQDIKIKEVLQLYTYTYIEYRKNMVYDKIKPLLNQEHSFVWLPDIEQTIELAFHHNLDDLAKELISLYEEYLAPRKDKSGFKYIQCKKNILEIYRNNNLSQDEKIRKLNSLNLLKIFDNRYYEEQNKSSQCSLYEQFIRALIFYEKEPIKTYQLLDPLYEKYKNSLYLFNMLSAFFKAYENDEYQLKKYKFVLNKYNNDIEDFIKESKTLFEFQILFYGYTQIKDYQKLNKLYSIAPNYLKDKLKDELPPVIDFFDKPIHIKNKLLICVEGQHDINFLKNINQNIEEFKNIVDIEKEENISFFDLKGSRLKQFVKENSLKGTNVIELHIYDSDLGSEKNELKYKKDCDEVIKRQDSSFCFMTQKRELENYIPQKLIEKEFKIDMSSITNWDKEDIPKFIQNKISNTLKEDNIKNILNGKLSKQITKKDLEELNAYEEIKSWFEKIKELSK